MKMKVWLLISFMSCVPSLGGCIFMPTKDSIPSMMEKLPELSQRQSKPLWQTILHAQETDFIKFLSPDRVLVGTVEAAQLGWGLEPKEILLLNAETGEVIWTSARGSLGNAQSLLITNPVILLGGSKKYAAFDPKNGSLIWERENARGGSLLLPDGEHLVLFSKGKSSVSLASIKIKDGFEAWTAQAENYPDVKGTTLDAKAVGSVVILVGPELVALSDGTGQTLWRKPFSGNAGAADAAIVLGDNLFFTDGATITRSDPTTGNAVWRKDFPPGSFRRMTAGEQSIFVLVRRAEGDDQPDAIQALDRKSGRALWKTDLPEQAKSSLVIEKRRIYLTTASALFALDASQGSLVFKASIPPGLRTRKSLPDILRITDDRIIVARESGVIAVQKQDGGLLYAVPVPDTAPFTNDYATHKLNHALESETPFTKRESVSMKVNIAYAEDMYRRAISHQQFVYASTEETIRRGTAMERGEALTERAHAAEASGITAQMRLNEQRMQAGIDFANSIAGLAPVAVSYIDAAVRGSRMSIMDAEVEQTFKTHAQSLQNDFFIRPRYEQDRGWSIALVNLKTGKRADILLSPPNYALSTYAANLPAFCIDPSGSRILSKGIGLDPKRFEIYEKVGYRDEWKVPYPSVLAFDLASIRYGQGSGSGTHVPKMIDPKQGRLNKQLITAAFQGDHETVKKALAAGANVNAVDDYGQTALMLAAESLGVYHKKDIISTLLERGADVTINDPGGWTALEHFRIVSGDLSNGGVSKGFGLLEKAQEKADQKAEKKSENDQ
jgi:outer membrane protein assembly factor BamB